jgi:hypothetical protein
MGLFSGILSGATKALGIGSSGWAAPLVGAGLSFLGGERANRQNVDLSNTAYPRSMADMRKAGLNPILAGKLGGASTPVMQNTMQPAVASAMQMRQTESNVGLQEQQEALMQEQVKEIAERIVGMPQARMLVAQDIQRVSAEVVRIGQQIELNKKQMDLLASQTEGVDLDNKQKRILADFYESAEFARIGKDLGMNAGMLKGLFTAIFGGKR